MNTTPTKIQQLNYDELGEIFRHIGLGKDGQQARLACKNWNTVYTDSQTRQARTLAAFQESPWLSLPSLYNLRGERTQIEWVWYNEDGQRAQALRSAFKETCLRHAFLQSHRGNFFSQIHAQERQLVHLVDRLEDFSEHKDLQKLDKKGTLKSAVPYADQTPEQKRQVLANYLLKKLAQQCYPSKPEIFPQARSTWPFKTAEIIKDFLSYIVKIQLGYLAPKAFLSALFSENLSDSEQDLKAGLSYLLGSNSSGRKLFGDLLDQGIGVPFRQIASIHIGNKDQCAQRDAFVRDLVKAFKKNNSLDTLSDKLRKGSPLMASEAYTKDFLQSLVNCAKYGMLYEPCRYAQLQAIPSLYHVLETQTQKYAQAGALDLLQIIAPAMARSIPALKSKDEPILTDRAKAFSNFIDQFLTSVLKNQDLLREQILTECKGALFSVRREYTDAFKNSMLLALQRGVFLQPQRLESLIPRPNELNFVTHCLGEFQLKPEDADRWKILAHSVAQRGLLDKQLMWRYEWALSLRVDCITPDFLYGATPLHIQFLDQTMQNIAAAQDNTLLNNWNIWARCLRNLSVLSQVELEWMLKRVQAGKPLMIPTALTFLLRS